MKRFCFGFGLMLCLWFVIAVIGNSLYGPRETHTDDFMAGWVGAAIAHRFWFSSSQPSKGQVN